MDLEIFKKDLPKETEYLVGSIFDTTFKEGEKSGVIKGEKIGVVKGEKIGVVKGERIGVVKGKYKKSVKAIRKMTFKNFSAEVIADLLEEKIDFVKTIQKQLPKEAKIITLFKHKKTEAQIAESLKLNLWFVECILESNKLIEADDKKKDSAKDD